MESLGNFIESLPHGCKLPDKELVGMLTRRKLTLS